MRRIRRSRRTSVRRLAPEHRSSAYALLASGGVVAVSLRSGRTAARRRVGPVPAIRISTSLLAWGANRGQLYALTPRRTGTTQRVVALRSGDLALRGSLALPTGVVFTALGVGTRTGTVYLLGTRHDQPVLATADAALSRTRAPRALHPAAGHDWLVIGAAVDRAEHRLVVSYHGETSTGADLVDVSGASPTPLPCEPTGTTGLGCIHHIHGTAAFVAGSLVATTGARDIRVFDAETGQWRKRLDSELPENHLTALAPGPGGGTVVIAGSCMQAGGLSVLDVGTARRRGYPAAKKGRGYQGICGDSVATRGNAAIVGALDAVGRGRLPAGLCVLDHGAGGRRRFVRMGSPLAVLLEDPA